MSVRESIRNPYRSAGIEVKIQGTLDQAWLQSYQGITADFDGEVTTLHGFIADQSALRGLLCTLWDFNLTILSMILVDSKKHCPDTGLLPERE